MIKKIIYKIIGFSLLILFGLDSTTFLEGLDENQETENNSNKSFIDYFHEYELEILTIMSLSLFIFITLVKLDIILINSDSFVNFQVIDQILNNLKHVTNDTLFDEILVLITDKKLTTNECIDFLQKMLKCYVDYPSLVNDPENFKKLMLDLIKEISKKN